MSFVLALVFLAIPSLVAAQVGAGLPPGSAPGGPVMGKAAAAAPAAPAGPNRVKVDKDAQGYRLLVDGRPTMVFGMNWDYEAVKKIRFPPAPTHSDPLQECESSSARDRK